MVSKANSGVIFGYSGQFYARRRLGRLTLFHVYVDQI